MKKLQLKTGFTFIEILISVLILSIIGAASFMTISGLTKTTEATRNRTMAVNLLQKSLEEVRRVAQTNFNQLETCKFPTFKADANPCGMDVISDTLPGFSRTLTATKENNSADLKRAVVKISFQEWGQTKNMFGAALIVRPPAPLPGNLIGKVKDSKTSKLIGGIRVRIVHAKTGAANATTSQVTLIPNKDANFDFVDFQTKAFTLSPGIWTLTASGPGYENYTHQDPINIGSNQQAFVAFEMVPLPEDATIAATVVHQKGKFISNFANAWIQLFSNSQIIGSTVNRTNFSFRIPFTTPDQRCFTLLTRDTYIQGYANQVIKGGGSPSCVFEYLRDGYSTAVFQEDKSVVCSNSYFGNAASDRICVNPGETKPVALTIGDVPEVIIKGQVVTSNGNPVAGATLTSRWPTGWNWIKNVQSDAQGNFTYSVPAVQGMFPVGQNLLVWANGNVPTKTCCEGTTGMVNRQSNVVAVGPLNPGIPGPDNIKLIIQVGSDPVCGNDKGFISDSKTGGGIGSAFVALTSGAGTAASGSTNGSGQYIFQCPAVGFLIPAGAYNFVSSHSQYYPYSSQGNQFYNPRSGVSILANQMVRYDAKMLQRGFGTITGTVRDKGTGNPIGNTTVRLFLYNGQQFTFRTAASGTFSFTNVLETWPPPAVSGDPYFRQTSMRHAISATHDGGLYEPYPSKTIPTLNAGQTLVHDIDLIRLGGL